MDVVRSFEDLKRVCGIEANKTGIEVFHSIKSKVTLKNAETFWKLLEHRMRQVTYSHIPLCILLFTLR